MSDIIGKTFESNTTGTFKVVGKAGTDKGSNRLYKVRFEETGYEVEAQKGNIVRGAIRDPYYPSVYGVGYMGGATGSEGGSEKRSYKMWNGMLRRCYKPDNPYYKNYGGRGISVCERWHSFEQYESDIQELGGYEDPERDSIDRIDNNGNYEPNNCRWATKKTQAVNTRRQKTFVAITPGPGDGFYFSNNQQEFAREHDLTQGSISGCLNGRQKTHKGWRFQYLDELEEAPHG